MNFIQLEEFFLYIEKSILWIFDHKKSLIIVVVLTEMF
jgi:hypothetical protein